MDKIKPASIKRLSNTVLSVYRYHQNGGGSRCAQVSPSKNKRLDDDPGILELLDNSRHNCRSYLLLWRCSQYKELQTERKGDWTMNIFIKEKVVEQWNTFTSSRRSSWSWSEGEHTESDGCSDPDGYSWGERGC